jgi:hypothetical protein
MAFCFARRACSPRGVHRSVSCGSVYEESVNQLRSFTDGMRHDAQRHVTPQSLNPSTYLAAVACLARPLRVGQLPLDRRGKVVVVDVVVGSNRLRRTRGNTMLNALDLVDKLRFVLRGPLGGHDGCNGRRYIPRTNNRWLTGWLDYGSRLTLSVDLKIHDVHAKCARKKREGCRGPAQMVERCLGGLGMLGLTARMRKPNTHEQRQLKERWSSPNSTRERAIPNHPPQLPGCASLAALRHETLDHPDRCHLVPDILGQTW